MSKTFRFTLPIILAVMTLSIFFYLIGAPNRVLASGNSMLKLRVDRKPDKTQSQIQSMITVNTLYDELNDDGDCSLREAIEAANSNMGVDACVSGDAVYTDTITFDVSGTIILDSQLGQLSVIAGGPLEIDGGNLVTVSGDGSTRVLFVESGSILTLQQLIVIDGSAVDGAGLYNNGGSVTIDDCTLFGNIVAGGAGGGIYNNAGLLVLANSSLSGNISFDFAGGGIYNGFATLIVTDSSLSNNHADSGGAIRNAGGTLSILRSTLVGNTARVGGAIENFGELVVDNSTLSQNQSAQTGAAIYNWFFIKVSNSTLSENIAGLGGAISNSYITMTITNTIVANYDSESNCSGPISDGGHNISSDDTCSFDPANGSMPNTDPMLGPLQDNGGPTLTQALLVGSPAIDAGDNTLCPGTDQRGIPRPQDGDENGSKVCDIGSYELESILISPSLVTITGPTEGVYGQSHAFTATIEPISTTLPLEYTWQASGQAPITNTNGLVDIVNFSWQESGMQVITVTARNLDGSVMDTHRINITDLPISGLSASNDSPTLLGDATTFTATITSGTNVSYTWDFGDGESGTGQVITHIYPSVGIYTATVTASNSAGSANADTQVSIQDIPISGLLALSDSPTLLGDATTFTATITSGTNVSYTWDFGDGNSDTGQIISHIYPSEGIFTAIVTASNSAGSATADTFVAIIQDVPIAGLIAFNDSPTSLGDATTFTATITSGTNVSYTWDFGDGESGIGQVITHVYSSIGIITATVTASNTAGSATADTQVTIQDIPITGLFAYNNSPTLLGEVTTFTATIQTGTNVSFTWDFGDGSGGNGQITTHIYPSVGIYTATVTATNSTNLLTAETTVNITLPTHTLYLPLVIRSTGALHNP